MGKRKLLTASLSLLLAFAFSACWSVPRKDVGPLHDEVLVYNLPMDLTFLRTLEALEHIPGWELAETEKPRGMIRVRNNNYAAWDDADLRQVTVLLSRRSRDQTAISLSPDSQRVRGAGDLLESIGSFLSREL